MCDHRNPRPAGGGTDRRAGRPAHCGGYVDGIPVIGPDGVRLDDESRLQADGRVASDD